MKKFSKLTVLLVLSLALWGCQKAHDNFYQYPFETAKITYQISGTTTGTSEVIIKDDRKYIKDNYVEKKLDGTESRENRITISTPEKIYILNEDTKTGSSFTNASYQEFKNLPPEKRQEKLIQLATQVSGEEANGNNEVPKPEGTEEIAGQKCEIYQTQYSKTCLWKGIPLKTTIDMSNFNKNTQTIATKIELEQPVDDKIFEVPADYKVLELK